MARSDVNCEKTSALCPSAITSSSCSRSGVEFGTRVSRALGIDQARVTRGLAQPQQRLENLDFRVRKAHRLHALAQRGNGSNPATHRRAVAARAAAHKTGSVRSYRADRLSTCDLVRRSITGRIAVASRPQLGVVLGLARFGELMKDGRAAQHARIEKVKQRPEILQMIFHRGAGQGQAVLAPATGGWLWRPGRRHF